MSVAFLSTPLAATALNPATLTVRISPEADLAAEPATWTFHDITTDVLYNTATNISHGRADEATQAQPSEMTLTLDNSTGNYSTRRPQSTYWPNMHLGFPVQVLVSSTASGAVDMFSGFVDTLKPGWDRRKKLPTVALTAKGILQRLQQGTQPPLRSALTRAIEFSDPLATWPMEDGTDATAIASGVGGPSGTTTGLPGIGDTSSPTLGGASSAIVLNSAGTTWDTVALPMPTYASTGFLALGLWFRLYQSAFTTTEVRLSKVFLTGSIAQLAFYAEKEPAPGGMLVSFQDSTGSELSFLDAGSTGTPGGSPDPYDGAWHNMFVTLTQSGSNVTAKLYVDDTLYDTRTITSYTLGNATSWLVENAGGDPAPISVSHPTVWTDSGVSNQYAAGLGYVGETATDRLERLCDEQGVPITITGTSDMPMGAQTTDTFINLLRECEATDHGVLRDGVNFGLGYTTRSARYNATVDLALDIDTGDVMWPFGPVENTQRVRNDVTASRKNGSSARYTQPAGAPYAPTGAGGVGAFTDAPTINPQTDTALGQHAAWLVHLGCVDEDRYPALNLDFGASPQIAAAWLASGGVGARITAAGLPVQAATVGPDLFIEGTSTSLTHREWSVAATCSPARPYLVGVVDTDRVDTAGSTVHTAVTAGASTIVVDFTDTRWVSGTISGGGAYFWVGGFKILVTSIAGTTSPQTLTVHSADVTAAIPAGAGVRLWTPILVALGDT